MEEKKITQTNQNEIICKNCAAKLTFKPGTTNLKCEFCGTENEIKIDQEKLKEATKEIDFEQFINNNVDTAAKMEVTTVKCGSCGAETTFDPNVTSSECDFCGSPMVADQKETQNIVKATALLPFKIEQKQSIEKFQTWLKKLWWAPSKLKQYARQTGKLTGIYLPYWTYDSDTRTRYSGQRGDNYQVEEQYTNSEGETDTRTVTKTRWSSASGTVYDKFDDIFVVGSKSLPVKYLDKLEPWHLKELVPYDPKFLAGFKSETYGVDVKEGFEVAKVKMEPTITKSIKNDIGGDKQRISSKNINYDDITFKHILLPLWISAYRFNEKVYRFMINGQTGEVQGERPYSWMKIALAILVVIAVIVALILIIR